MTAAAEVYNATENFANTKEAANLIKHKTCYLNKSVEYFQKSCLAFLMLLST